MSLCVGGGRTPPDVPSLPIGSAGLLDPACGDGDGGVGVAGLGVAPRSTGTRRTPVSGVPWAG
jgi:hypothetical protein